MTDFPTAKKCGDLIVDEEGQTYVSIDTLFNYVEKKSELSPLARYKFITDRGQFAYDQLS